MTPTSAPHWFPLDASSAGEPAAAADSASDARPVALFDVAAIRRIEASAMATVPAFTLMARAGATAADWLAHHVPEGAFLVLAGPGNNGGDALVAATLLHRAGRVAPVWLIGEPSRLPADAARAWREATEAGVSLTVLADGWPDAPPCAPPGLAAAVDGLLGIGLTREPQGAIAACIAHLQTLADGGIPVFSLDVPSGLDADAGSTGKPGTVVHATRTLTFIAAKPGLLTLDGRDCAGAADIAPIGLDAGSLARSVAAVNGPAVFAHALPRRNHAAHKGTFGSLAVIGGGTGMVGAPLLGARAALQLGAGRVHVGFLARSAPAVDLVHPELMLHGFSDVDFAAMSALVIGPGMGAGPTASSRLSQCLRAAGEGKQSGPALVLDADALNLLAADARLAARLRASTLPRVMTPHPLEAARLAGKTLADIQRNRLASARALAEQWQAVIVLKGSGTVIAAPGEIAGETTGEITGCAGDSVAWINPTGNAGLATAGSGDVLAGMIGALLAQGMPPAPAACAAVWMHGRAADRLVALGHGPAGLTAGELALPARDIFNQLLSSTGPSPLPSPSPSQHPAPPHA